MDILSGQVTGIRYRNQQNGWTIAAIEKADFEVETAVGIMPGLSEGLTIEASGEWVEHPTFGHQFKVQSYRTEHPSDIFSIRAYLENVIDGIGPALAERIVRAFGTNTVSVMDEAAVLRDVPGIGKVTAEKIVASWREHETERGALEEILGFLAQYGLSPHFARKLFQSYGFDAVKVVNQNPYTLMELDGIAFLRADAIAKAMGIADDDTRRVRAGLIYMVDQATEQGHCYTDRATLLSETQQQIVNACPLGTLEQELDLLLTLPGNDVKLVEEDGAIYPASLYAAETGLAREIVRLMNATPNRRMAGLVSLEDAELVATLPTGITYTDEQREAILDGLKMPVSVITGGPGTGKSTIINAIVAIAEGQPPIETEGAPIIVSLDEDRRTIQATLMAPTGLAAKRMKDVTGHDAGTVHRTLGTDPISGGFIHNENLPLEGDIFVIDESSMLDLRLAYSLVRAIPSGANVVFVGDIDQLPAVGPGNVLRDVIDSGLIPVTRLTHIFRQGEDSLIIPNAHAINSGRMPDFAKGGTRGDFYLFPTEDTNQAADYVIDLATKRIPTSFGVKAEDIHVLSPQKKTGAGVQELNRRLQAELNPPSPAKSELPYGTITFREGDRVIRVSKNDYEKGVVNGDQGVVVEIGKTDKGQPRMWVKFDNRDDWEEDLVSFDGEDLGTMRHAYALTVHKAQGLEFPVVIVVVLTAHYRMLVRNLIYTAVTRAKQMVVLVGSRKALGIAIGNDRVQHRATRLRERLVSERQKGGD